MEENQFSPLAMQFDKDYWAAQPEDVQALQSLPALSQERYTLGFTLATEKGRKIDVPIMLWGWGPWLVHYMRTNYGIAEVKSMEGIGVQGDPDAKLTNADNGTLPTVEYDPADMAGTLARLHALYPLPVPPPPPPPPAKPVVGNWIYQDMYGVGSGCDVKGITAGTEVVQNGRTYAAQVTFGLMGKVVYFKLIK